MAGVAQSKTGEAVDGRRKLRVRPRGKIHPPLMPLIDVMFTLMLFFLIAARTRGAEGLIPANLPDVMGPNAGAELKVDPITILLVPRGNENEQAVYQLGEGGSIYNTAEELFQGLTRLRAKYDSKTVPVKITPSGVVRWGHVVNAFNQAVRAEYKQVGFAPSS